MFLALDISIFIHAISCRELFIALIIFALIFNIIIVSLLVKIEILLQCSCPYF